MSARHSITTDPNAGHPTPGQYNGAGMHATETQ